MVYYVMKKRGFTLVELLAVIAILGILVTVISVAVLKIYNSSVEKTMEVQNKNVKRAAATFLEDYCIDPVDGSFVCPETYENRYYNKFVCLGDLRKDTKNSYIEKVTYKGDECNGVIIFTADEEGELTIPNPYLYCKWNEKEEIYDYMTNPTLDVSDYEVCGIKQPKVEGELTAPDAVYCHFDGDLTQGAEFVKGSYTYRYKQEVSIVENREPYYDSKKYDESGHNGFTYDNNHSVTRLSSSSRYYFYYEKYWKNISDDGWGVSYTGDPTKKNTDAMCTYINDKPVVSMSYTFLDVPLQNVALNKINTRTVKNMSFTFANTFNYYRAVANYNNSSNIIKLEFDPYYLYRNGILDLRSLDTRNVINMSGMFYGNPYGKIIVSSFDTRKVKDMSYMFTNTYLNSLSVGNFNTSNVTNMMGMFADSRISTTLDLSNFNTSKVTDMSRMFSDYYGSKITGINKFDTSNVTTMSYMFSDIYIGDVIDLSNFKTDKVVDMSGMFYRTDLSAVSGIENFNTSNVTDMSSMFYDSDLGDFDFSNLNTNKVKDMSSMFRYANVSQTKNLGKLNTSNVTNMSYMFYNTTGSTLDLSGFDTSKVTDMSYMFKYNSATNINVSNFNTANVTDMSSLFGGCSADILDLSSFTLKDGVNLNDMFLYSSATAGYAKDANTAAKFNDKSVTGIPDELTFTVK